MSQTYFNYCINYLKAILKNQGKINFSYIGKNVSHDGLTRALKQEFPWQKLHWNFLKSYLKLGSFYLVLDDTILEKPHSRLKEWIRYIYSHKDKKSIRGVQIVVLLLVNGNLRIPIAFRIYDKKKTKIQLALDMFSYARNTLGIKKTEVYFDSWYSSKDILKRLRDYGWTFVCRIKRNRNLNGKQVKKLISNPYGERIGKLNHLKFRVKLIRNEKHYLITNRLSLTKQEIITSYSKRSVIEEIFRILKSNFNAKDCQSRTRNAWENHLHLVLLAYSFMELKRQKSHLTIYKIKRSHRLRDYDSYFSKLKRILINA